MITELTTGLKAFNQFVKENERVVVNFWGNCDACDVQDANLKVMDKKFYPTIRILFVNVDKKEKVKSHFSIRGTPTLMVYYKREPVALMTREGTADRIVGLIPRDDLEELFRAITEMRL